ncbi:hypothetical protein B0H14DRAFT_3555755 [Mycena olivaceomarginata]|nr:hypothetical protein B0H14DRAFT_3555755 [Mycena olivaceomarginata]
MYPKSYVRKTCTASHLSFPAFTTAVATVSGWNPELTPTSRYPKKDSKRSAINQSIQTALRATLGPSVPNQFNPFDNVLVVDKMEIAYSTLLSCPTLAKSGLSTQNLALDGVNHPWILTEVSSQSGEGSQADSLPNSPAIATLFRPGYAGGVTEQSKVTHGIFFYLAQEEGLISNTSIHAGIRCKLGGAEDLENDEAVGSQLITTDDIDDLGISEIIRLVREFVSLASVINVAFFLAALAEFAPQYHIGEYQACWFAHAALDGFHATFRGRLRLGANIHAMEKWKAASFKYINPSASIVAEYSRQLKEYEDAFKIIQSGPPT